MARGIVRSLPIVLYLGSPIAAVVSAGVGLLMSSTVNAPSSAADRATDSYVPLRPLPPLPAKWGSLPRALVVQARERWSGEAMVDSTGARLSYGKTLVSALALGRALARTWGRAEHVGLLVPPTVPGAVANLAVTLRGKIPVNLNYSASQSLVDSCIDQCGITHILTSAKVLDRFKIIPKGKLILLEDIRKQITLADKLWAAVVAKVVPLRLLSALVPGLYKDHLDATATVIFTSGSTGDPKGVVLSHRNVLSNVHQVEEAVRLKPEEVVLGILPFFHSFGFTITIWTALCLNKKVVYHFNPLDARTIGKLCEEHKVTLLIGTPSFTRLYLKSCEPRQFKTITHWLVGAEKLKPELARDLQAALGIEPLEGYGCTELSPVVAVNVPRELDLPDGRKIHGNRLGTVGLSLPGTAIKTIDPETMADLPAGTEGMIAVKGPQVMVGYLNRPEATAQVLKAGWYFTGDIGYVDPEGFLKITDRISRFSKIAGEMVPHLAIESAIVGVTGVDENCVAVTGVPDPKHGERLFVLYTDLGMTPAEVQKRLTDGPLPKVWIPSPRDFIHVDEIPITPTGKVDLRRLKDIALHHGTGEEQSKKA
jgi:acyl-[acyl-carrier-protein]-phospholipid O-acyltransferase / long-chain-fatty-acid--[acyl-carrier-protein] ligase